MASFDPSIISQIPDYAGNPMEARAKGYKLADLITEQQRNKLLLGQQQEQIQEQQKARDILKNFKGNIGSAEGNIELAGQYGKAGLPKQAMESLQFGSEQQTRDLQQKELRLRALDLSANIIGPAALQVKQVLQSQGLPAAQQLYSQLKSTIPQEFQQNLPPQLPNDPQQAMGMLDQATAISSRARQMLDEQRKERETAVKERGETEREREDRARDVRGERTEARLERALSQKTAAGEGFADPKVQALEASIASTGFSLPAGFRAKEQQLSLYQGLLRKYDGLEADDIAKLLASNAIDYKGISKATQTAAGIAGKVEFANNELNQFVPIAKDASAAVDRTSFVPFNKLAQIGKANISDPDQKRLFVATQTILNAYDLLAARGGTDKDKRAENRKILETADGPEAYNAALDMIVREGQAAGVAAQKSTKAGAYGGIPGGKETTETTKVGNTFSNEADAEAAARAGKIKKGDKIIVGGVSGTWQ